MSGHESLEKTLEAVKNVRNTDFAHALRLSIEEATYDKARASIKALLKAIEEDIPNLGDDVVTWRSQIAAEEENIYAVGDIGKLEKAMLERRKNEHELGI